MLDAKKKNNRCRHLLKTLQVRKNEILTELHVLHGGAGNVEREAALRKELARLVARIAGLGQHANHQPYVTEHALLRYLERVRGIDLDSVKKEMLTPERLAMIKVAPNCEINIGGIKFIVRDSAVITARAG